MSVVCYSILSHVQTSTFYINHSIPSFKPKCRLDEMIYIPSLSLALQATIVHALSLIISKFNNSSISSAGNADNKSYLFAYINIGNPASLSSFKNINKYFYINTYF